MKILYVGDFRDLPNWGCRATGVALRQLLETRHTIIETLGVETLNGTGWDLYAPCIRYGGLLPGRFYYQTWKRRQQHRAAARAWQRLDQLLGARHDYVSAVPEQSVREFHVARKTNPRLEEIHRSLQECDAVVFNGEGTMIYSQPARRDVLFNLFFIALSIDYGKKVFFLNSMFSECPQTGLNQQTVEAAGPLLAACDAVVCRDCYSADFVRRTSPAAAVSTIPDALFTWQSKVERAVSLVREDPDLALSYGQDWTVGTLDFQQPYVCLSGSSSAHLHPDPASSYARLASRLSRLGLRTYLICTCAGDWYLHEVGRRTGLTVIPHTVSVRAGAAIVAGARLLVSGRFHPSIMATLGGTPCVFLGSNSHKTRTLQEVLEYPAIREFSDVPPANEDDEIEALARALLEQGESRRMVIRQTAAKRASEARRVLDAVEGSSPISLL